MLSPDLIPSKMTATEICGMRLMLLRSRKKKSRQQVCNATGVSMSALINYEAGQAKRLDILLQLCKYYDVTPNYLLGYE